MANVSFSTLLLPPPARGRVLQLLDGTEFSTVGNCALAGPAGRPATGTRGNRHRRHAHLPADYGLRQPFGHAGHRVPRRLDRCRRNGWRSGSDGRRPSVAATARSPSRQYHRRRDAIDVRRGGVRGDRLDVGGHRRGRRRGRAAAIQTRIARHRQETGRRGPAGDHAIRAHHVHYPAGPAEPELWPVQRAPLGTLHGQPAAGTVRRVQPLRNVADGRADRGVEPGRLHHLQVPGPRRGNPVGRHPRRGHLQHGHHRQLFPRNTGRPRGRARLPSSS